jgi:MFS transporter, DHA1 family, inner membrane transport protein
VSSLNSNDDKAVSNVPLLILLCISLFLISCVMAMLGPLLVPIADEFHTSVAIAGQLVTVTALVWGVVAFGAGPLSDTYGRRLMVLAGITLAGLGLFGGALATSFHQLVLARVITGLGGAMLPPTCFAASADLASIHNRSRVLSWVAAASVMGMAGGVPVVAWLAGIGGWRMPFWALGAGLAVMWLWAWFIFPRHVAAHGPVASFMSRVREASIHGNSYWGLLVVNMLSQTAFFGMAVFLPAYLMQTYQLTTAETIWPLSLMGLGLFAGALAGGKLPHLSVRRVLSVTALLVGGVLVCAAFSIPVSLWATVVFTSAAGALFSVTQPMVLTSLITLAGEARGTATGMFALSNQISAMVGTAIGGLLLVLGGFSYIGIGCLVMSVIAAIMMAQITAHIPLLNKSQDSAQVGG